MPIGRLPPAIGFVLVGHALPLGDKSHDIGHMGVLLFFSLSGYLITTKLLEEFHSTATISLRDFYLRRAFRILPPAVTYLSILGALAALGWIDCDLKSILAALFFWVNYLPVAVVAWKAGHFWSLSVEEHFYLVWPLILIISGVSSGWRSAAIAALAVCVWRAIQQNWQWLLHTDYIADTLFWGCCLAFVPRLKVPYATLAAAVLFATFCFVNFGPGNPTGRLAVPINHLLPTLILGAIIMAPERLVGRFLETAPLRFMGRLSYSLYIWQQAFLGGPGGHLPLPLALAALFAVAYASYRWIEKPAIRLGQRVVANFRAEPLVLLS